MLSSSHGAAAAAAHVQKGTLFLTSGLRGGLKRSRRMNKYARFTCIYMFSSVGKSFLVFFFPFSVIFMSSPGGQETGGQETHPGLIVQTFPFHHLLKCPETDTDVLHHLHFKCVQGAPGCQAAPSEAGSAARGWDQTPIRGQLGPSSSCGKRSTTRQQQDKETQPRPV